MTRARTSACLLLSAAIAAAAVARGLAMAGEDEPPDIEIIEAEIGGSGCPEGTARAVLSDDKRTLSIIFDEYMAEDSEYAHCNIAVSLSVPEGITLALVDVDYRGYASVPDESGHKAQFRTEYFFAGDMGPVRVHKFYRDYDANFMISHDIKGKVWAPCGAEVIARANTSIRTWGSGTMLSIDTADVTTDGITFDLDWDEC
jgi:hypothetical protein